MRLPILVLVLLWSAAHAQPTPCPEGGATGTLEGANVRARLFTNGNLFYGPELPFGTGYLVPLRGADAGMSPISMIQLWIGASAGSERRVSAGSFSYFGYRPGRIRSDGTPPTPDDCAAADRIWVVSREDVSAYLTDRTLTDDLRDWPVSLGAPVLDGDGDPTNYNLNGGDQPALRGDVMAYWAMTDAARPRDLPQLGLPLGVDVSVEAFAFRTGPAVGGPSPTGRFASSTFYRYTITNRSGVTLDSLRVGLLVQHEIGNVIDSYVATDTTRQMAIGYNSDNVDDGGYAIPPAFGIMVVDSPPGTDGRPVGLGAMRVSYNVAGGSPILDPATPQGIIHALAGRWNDGLPIREGGIGYGPSSGRETLFAYAGDPVTGAFWSERNVDGTGLSNAPGQRRLLPSSGPLTLAPGAAASWLFGVLFAQGDDYLDSVVRLRGTADLTSAVAAAGGFEPRVTTPGTSPSPAPVPEAAVRRPAPNPFTGSTMIRLVGLAGADVTVRVIDVLGRTLDERRLIPAADDEPVTVGDGLAAGTYIVRVSGRAFDVALPVVKRP